MSKAIATVIAGVVLGLATAHARELPPSVAEQFQALRTEYDRASSSGVPLTDAQRQEFIGRVYRHRTSIAEKLLKLAQDHPNDPVALPALTLAVWQVNTIPWPVELVGVDSPRAKVFAMIHRDHLENAGLGPLCQRVSYGFCQEYETFLRAVVAKSPHRSVQAIGGLSLAQFLHNRLQRVDLCRAQPQQAQEFAGLYGREYFAELERQDRDAVLKEVAAVFERTAKEFRDVMLPSGESAAQRAEAALFEIRHLSVGKAAPDLEGVDQHGVRFRLSDYRGKVVLLDFWSYV